MTEMVASCLQHCSTSLWVPFLILATPLVDGIPGSLEGLIQMSYLTVAAENYVCRALYSHCLIK